MSRRHRNKAKMEDVDWQFVCDAVFGFLASPLWNLPVMTFMEENCIVFDPDEDQPEIYKEVHGRYKDMVDGLLSSFVKDIGITSEQFVAACTRSNAGQNAEFHKSMFEQILAADDYEMFKRLMNQKNIQLQMQALRLIQQRSGSLPDSLVKSNEAQPPPKKTQSNQAQVDEDAILQEVLRKSKEEFEAQEKAKSKAKEKDVHKVEKELVETVHVESKRLEEKAIKEKEHVDRLVSASLDSKAAEPAIAPTKTEKPPIKEAMLKAATTRIASQKAALEQRQCYAAVAPMPQPVANPGSAAVQAKQSSKPKSPKAELPQSPKTELPPVNTKAPVSSAQAASSWLESAKAEAAAAEAAPSSSSASGQGISQDEIKKRAEYLKQQRDKLLALKKQEREKKLDSFAQKEPSARPSSARAAKRIIVQEEPETSKPELANTEEEEKKIAMRRALAARLKQEVVGNH